MSMESDGFKVGDRVYVTDPGLAELRAIMAAATGSAPDNHRGTVDEIEGAYIYIVFDDGCAAPYPASDVRHEADQ